MPTNFMQLLGGTPSFGTGGSIPMGVPGNMGNLDTLMGLLGGATGVTGDPRMGSNKKALTSMDLIGLGLRPPGGGSGSGTIGGGGSGLVGVNPSSGPFFNSATSPLGTEMGTNIPMASVGGSSMGSNLVPSVAGDQEKLLDTLFTTGATGQGSNKVGLTLNSLAQGFLPQPMQDWITADANENFGKLGARFGTDLGGQITRNLGLAGSQQALSAMHELFGLGGTTAGFQFQRSENALDRALKEWQTSQQTDLSSQLLMALLGGG